MGTIYPWQWTAEVILQIRNTGYAVAKPNTK